MKQLLLYVFSLMATMMLTSCKSEDKKGEITIACNLPLSGYVGVFGTWMKNGFDMALSDNAESNAENGIVVKFDYQDNKGVNRDAISILQKQLLAKPDIIFSGLTGQTMSIIDQVKKEELPHFMVSFTPVFLREGDLNFRTFPNFGVESKHYINFIKEKEPKKIAFLYVDIVGTKSQINDVVIPSLDADIEILNERYPASMTDYKSLILKIGEFKPDVIIINGFYNNLVNIIKTMHSYKIPTQNLMCSMDLLDTVELLSHEELEGIHVTAPAVLIPAKQTERMKHWIDQYKSQHKKSPSFFEAYAYDMLSMIFNAALIMKTKNITLVEALNEVEMEGVTGKLKFDKTGEIEYNMHTVKFKKGILEF